MAINALVVLVVLVVEAKDTLARGGFDVISRGGRCLHLLSVGELRQQPRLKVLAALVLLAPVDEHFVLQTEAPTAATSTPRAKTSAPSTELGIRSTDTNTLSTSQQAKNFTLLTLCRNQHFIKILFLTSNSVLRSLSLYLPLGTFISYTKITSKH